MYQWTEVDELCRMIANHNGDVSREITVNERGDVTQVTLVLDSEEDGPKVWIFPVTAPVSEPVVRDYIRNSVRHLTFKASAEAV